MAGVAAQRAHARVAGRTKRPMVARAIQWFLAPASKPGQGSAHRASRGWHRAVGRRADCCPTGSLRFPVVTVDYTAMFARQQHGREPVA